MKNSSKLILIFAIVLMVIVVGIEGWYIFGILKKPDNNSNNINKTEKDDSMTVDNNVSNDKKNESNNNNAQVAQDYSKWLGKWTDNKNNVFTVEKIENGTITFSWTLYRIASMGNITLPLNDSKAIFYFPVFEDKNYNGKQDEGELVYRKATVTLESSGVTVNITNTTAEEANKDATQVMHSGGFYISLGKYEYNYKEDYSKWLGKWTDGKNGEFVVEKAGNCTLTFSWTLYRIATMGNITLPLNDSKAIFYIPAFEDKNYNGKQDEGELVYRKATVTLENSGVIVNVTNTTAEEANLNVTQIINSGGPYISLGKYEYTIKE